MKSHAKIFSDLLIRKHFLVGALLVLVSLSLFAQPNVKDIGLTIKQGNAKGLSSFFDKHIELVLSGKSVMYSKNQAEIIIQKFFSKVDPTNFIDERSGNSYSNSTSHTIGHMVTSNGTYKVYMFFMLKSGNYLIREIRFEKIN